MTILNGKHISRHITTGNPFMRSQTIKHFESDNLFQTTNAEKAEINRLI
jgi:hypothetical protein